MKPNTRDRSAQETGAALIIAIFSLMLISVVATSLLLSAGTQFAIKSNYKSSMHAFYDAKAGLEEGRGRLWASNPNAITNCVFPAGPPMPAVNVCYIVNPSGGENVDPTNLDPANPYADTEYQKEWGTQVTNAAVQRPFITSQSNIGGIAGPLYKWVRITPRTVSPQDNTLLFFDGQHTSTAVTASQILTITSLAVTPAGSRRMVQYTVAPGSIVSAMPTFPAALTLDGNDVSFTGPNMNTFHINGNDMDAPSGTVAGVGAVGFTNNADSSGISAAAVPASSYLSPTGTTPVGLVSVPPILQTPSSLDLLVQTLTQNADLVLNPAAGSAADQTSLPAAMSASNPMIVVVNGDFNLHGYGTGYGLLVVTGTLDYDPDASWKGIILVIGKGIFISTKGGTGELDGAVFIAQTRDAAGNLLNNPNSMHSSFRQTGGGSGIHYSSKWISATQGLVPYQVLSFREIDQTIP